MIPEHIKEQQEKDRLELVNLPNGSNKPISWCNAHDCKMGTCFSLHYPESFGAGTIKYDKIKGE